MLLQRSVTFGTTLMFLLTVIHPVVYGAGLNTDVALTPAEGGTIFRLQWRYSERSNDPTSMGRNMTVRVHPLTVVHGISEKWAILGTVPLIYRQIEFDSQEDLKDTGIGDIPLLFKYRFYQNDRVGITTRMAVIGGVEIPTYDEAFSSKSFDPIIGAVWTHQRRDWWIDWDVVYTFNTASGLGGDDRLRLDTASSVRIFTGESQAYGPWGFYGIAEMNVAYITDGSTQVFLSPGLQYITPRWILEAGVQFPVHQDMKSSRLETDFTTVLSFRFQM